MPTRLTRYQQRQKELAEQEASKTGNFAPTPAPTPIVAGASTSVPSDLTAAQIGGASGIGFEDAGTQAEASEQISATLEAGGNKAAAGDRVSPEHAASLVSSSGLGGVLDPTQFAGKTIGEVTRLISEEKTKRTSQVSALSSSAFNPETINKTQRAVDKFNFALNETTADPFDHKDVKLEKQQSALDITSKEIGKLFNSADELFGAYQTNPQFQATIDKFLEKGGTLQDVAKNVGIPVVGTGPQSTQDFLAGITNPQANQEAQDKAIEEMAPEREIAQAEIARQAQIPEQLKNLYFGTEKEIGILQMRQEQAIEEKRILEEREKDATRTVRERAELSIAKNNADAKIEKSKIEENRLAAKNYMTGMLAKLGALKTTGAAPLALQTLDTKYEIQAQTLDSNYKYANEAIEVDMRADLDEIENQTDEEILGIQEDLTKSSEQVAKEVMKAQQAADKATYTVTEQYARRLRTATVKYTSEMEKAAKAYAKDYAKTASAGLELDKLAAKFGEGKYVPNRGVLMPDGTYGTLKLTPTQQQEVQSSGLSGEDNMRYFLTLPKAFRDEWNQAVVSAGRNFNFKVEDLRNSFEQWGINKERVDEEEDGEFSGF